VSDPLKVDVFSDYACPWCYLGLARLKQALGDRPFELRILHFPLSPDTPQEGRDLRAHLEAKGYDVDAAWHRLKTLLDAEDLPWHSLEGSLSYNTRLAQELASWAVTQPGGEGIHDALFQAYQVEQRNIGEVDVLVAIAGTLGLDESHAREVLTARTHREDVDQHWRAARESGVSGVPTYVVGGRGVVGAQSVEVLTRLLDTAD
jgi:predicted DsbA family dithiol-disulfide isomerase